MQTKYLIQNMQDQIMEAQLKLGYARETVRLFYPFETLCSLLDVPANDVSEAAVLKMLREDPELKNGGLGDPAFRIEKGRAEVSVPPEGVEYVHREVPVPAFLRDLIGLFREHHACSLQQICSVFERYNQKYCCRKMPAGTDFDYVLSFPDKDPDPYYYCIHQEMGHTIYHRFLEMDYKALLE